MGFTIMDGMNLGLGILIDIGIIVAILLGFGVIAINLNKERWF